MIDWDRTLNVGTLVIACLYAFSWWLVAKRKSEVAITCLFEGLAIGQLVLRAFGGFFPTAHSAEPSYESASLFFVAALAAIVSLVAGAYRRALAAAGT